MKKAPANRYGRGEAFRDDSTKAGKVLFRTVRMTEEKTSFHDPTKLNNEAAARPGNANGKVTLINAVTPLQPKI